MSSELRYHRESCLVFGNLTGEFVEYLDFEDILAGLQCARDDERPYLPILNKTLRMITFDGCREVAFAEKILHTLPVEKVILTATEYS